MFKPLLVTGLVLCAAVPLIAGAQSATPPPRPSNEGQAPQSEAYRSAFEGYKPYTEEVVGDWKAINATTAKIGGWRVYAKEARQPQASDVSVEPGKSGTSPMAPAKP